MLPPKGARGWGLTPTQEVRGEKGHGALGSWDRTWAPGLGVRRAGGPSWGQTAAKRHRRNKPPRLELCICLPGMKEASSRHRHNLQRVHKRGPQASQPPHQRLTPHPTPFTAHVHGGGWGAGVKGREKCHGGGGTRQGVSLGLGSALSGTPLWRCHPGRPLEGQKVPGPRRGLSYGKWAECPH